MAKLKQDHLRNVEIEDVGSKLDNGGQRAPVDDVVAKETQVSRELRAQEEILDKLDSIVIGLEIKLASVLRKPSSSETKAEPEKPLVGLAERIRANVNKTQRIAEFVREMGDRLEL
jgi:hypothetical protein